MRDEGFDGVKLNVWMYFGLDISILYLLREILLWSEVTLHFCRSVIHNHLAFID